MPARQVLGETVMPRSIQDVLGHADDLAKQFEEYEPAAVEGADV